MNIIEIKDLLVEKYGCNEYLEKYLEIVSSDDDASYTEKHHILPKSIWPAFEDLKANEWNCVHLSAYSHFMAHYYFSMATGDCWAAVKMMAHISKKCSFKNCTAKELHQIASLYESCKGNLSHSDETKSKMSASLSAAKKGRPLSEKNIAALSAAKKGRPLSEKNKVAIRAALTGKKLSEAHKAAQRAAQNRPEVKAKLRAAMRKGEHWQKYDELFQLWRENNRPKRGNFRKLAVANNYPDADYLGMVAQFNRDIDSNPVHHQIETNVVQLKVPTTTQHKVNQNTLDFLFAA